MEKKHSRRRGVALIIVLGFLSIMILMAVAFLTQARVERLVAGASMEGMRSRHMAQTALAAAMQDYLNFLKLVPPDDSNAAIFLSGDGPVSMGQYYSGEIMGNERLVVGEIENWITPEHLKAALLGPDLKDRVANAEWIWVREQPGARSRILGRYAYACFDMSGMIDAHLLGNEFGDNLLEKDKYGGSRTNRNNVRKMLFDAMLAQPETGNDRQVKLNKHLKNWIGFDTPAALKRLTDGKVVDGQLTPGDRWTYIDIGENEIGGINPDGLSCYSYSVLHKGAPPNNKIFCSADDIEQDPDIGGYFKNIIGDANRADVIKALKDYESPVLYPLGTDYPSVKNVPMFNEIGFQLELEEGPTTTDPDSGEESAEYSLIVKMKPEFWYPFPSKDNARSDNFNMPPPKSVGCGSASSGAGDIWVRVGLGPPGTPNTQVQASGVEFSPPEGLTVRAKPDTPYVAENNGGVLEMKVQLVATGNKPFPPGMNLFARGIGLNQSLVLQVDDRAVDAVPAGLNWNLTEEIPSGQASDWVSLAVSDPRLNHDKDNWNIEDPPSLGDVNKATTDAISEVSSTNIAPGKYLYCRNRPMQSPAELGYLSNGKPWETLDIFSENGINLMNRLVCDPNIMSALNGNKGAFFTNGTINPYTLRSNVLHAAFYGIDVREVPGMSGDPSDNDRIGEGRAKDIAGAFLEEKAKNGHAGWGRWLHQDNLLPGLNKNNRIALMHNTWGLFNESDRLFVVAVIAQSIREGEGAAGLGNWNPDEDMITGERRAVALCWLDGSTEGAAETLTQEMNIIMFQYLNE